jgi:hypothetical protein
MCSIDPSRELTWRVRNPESQNILLTYDIFGTNIIGSITALANTDTFFNTPRHPSGANTLRLFRNGVQVAVKASGFAQCATPTPQPTNTVVPTETPLPEPSPTVTPTLAPVVCKVEGNLRDGYNKMSRTFLRRVISARTRVIVTALRGTARTFNHTVRDDEYSIEVPCNIPYRVRVDVPNRAFEVRSKPVTHTLWVKTSDPIGDGLDFGLWATQRNTGSSSSSSSSTRRSK